MCAFSNENISCFNSFQYQAPGGAIPQTTGQSYRSLTKELIKALSRDANDRDFVPEACVQLGQSTSRTRVVCIGATTEGNQLHKVLQDAPCQCTDHQWPVLQWDKITMRSAVHVTHTEFRPPRGGKLISKAVWPFCWQERPNGSQRIVKEITQHAAHRPFSSNSRCLGPLSPFLKTAWFFASSHGAHARLQ